jgi:hypothetical protein
VKLSFRRLALLALVVSIAERTRIRSGALDPSLFAFAAKMLGSAGSPLVGLAGVAAAVSSGRSRDPVSALAGGVAALLSADFIRSVTTPHQGFERVLGPDWHAAIPPDLARRFLPRRWNGYLRLPLRTPSWANASFAPPEPEDAIARGHSAHIETVISILTTAFKLERPRGRSLAGHVVRVVTYILAQRLRFFMA